MSEELIAQAKSRIEDLLQPIAGGVGEDVSYDEKFELIKTETDKLSSLTGETCAWETVTSSCEELLHEKSKDFRVACYLATSKLRAGSLAGVLDALVLMQELTNAFWDGMYPPLRRIRARAGMVGWMSEQSGAVVQDLKLNAADAELVKTIDETSAALDQSWREKFGEHYPSIVKLRDAIRHLARSVPKEAPKEPPKKEPPPKPAPVPKPAAAALATPAPVGAPAGGGGGPGAADVNNAADARRALGPTGRLLVKLGAVLRHDKPDDPLAYRLTRLGAWLEVSQPPPVTDGKTLVPPPPPHVRQRLDTLAGAHDWLTLLNEAETVGSELILWLDPHRYASTAMSALGALFLKAKQELLLQVALHLKKVPNLHRLAFNDGTPFADGQTQMWIDNEVVPVLAGDGGGGGRPAAAASVLDEPLKEAREHAMKGDLAKGIAVVAAAADHAPTPAERFRGKLAIAQLCLGAGQFAIARGQLEGLTEQIERHDLTKWDPALCAEVFAALYSAHRGANEAALPKPVPGAMPMGPPPTLPPEAKAAEEAAFELLCQLDPATALKLAGKK